MRRVVVFLTILGCYHPAPVDERAVLREASEAISAPAPRKGVVTEEDVVALALSLNPSVIAAKGDVAVARAAVRETRQLDNPGVRVTNEEPLEDRAAQILVGLRWQPPHPWVHNARTARAEAAVALAEARLAREEARAVRDARLAYYRAAHAKARLALAQERLSLLEEKHRLLQTGVDREFSDPLDLSRAALALAEERGALARARGRDQEAIAALARESGLAADVPPLDPTACRPPPEALPDPLEAPPVRVARAAHRRSEAELRLQHARQVPWLQYLQLGFEHRFRHEASESNPKPDPARNTMVFGLSLDLPFLNWNLGGVARAEAERDRDASWLRSAIKATVLAQNSALARWRSARDAVVALSSEAMPAVLLAVEAEQKAMAAGRISEIRAIEAKVAATDSRRALLDAALDCLEAMVEAEYILGKTR